MIGKLARTFVCLAVAAFAQSQTGTLSGNLTGVTGKNGVVLILTDATSGVAQRVTVGTDGRFSIALPPGTYRVEVERDGFKQAARQNVEINTGAATQLNVTIEGGPAIETVELKAEAPAAQDDPPDIGRGFTSTTVRSVPVLDRNYQQLIGTMSGITPPVSRYPLAFDPQSSRQHNANGLPAYTNDHTSDGITIREPFTGELSVRVMPDEAVQQLNVRTSNYPPQHGFAAGSNTNVFLRPGTNGLHGSLFGFFSSDQLRTRNSFTPANVADPGMRNWQFGATAGGSLIPDRLFFFGSYEGTIRRGADLQFATVPTASLLAGNFAGTGATVFFPNTGTNGVARVPFGSNSIPSASFNPIAQSFLSFLPAANLPGLSNNLAANVPFRNRGNVLDGRADYRFTDAFSGFLRYGWSKFNTDEGSIFGPIVGGDAHAGLRNHHASASFVGNYHGIIGEFRVGYSRYRNQIMPGNETNILAQRLAAQGFGNGGIPSVTIEGLGTLGRPAYLPAKDVDNMYEGAANFHLFRARNQIVVGVDIRDLESRGFYNPLLGVNGGFFFGPGATSLAGGTTSANSAFVNSFASFLLGAPTTAGFFLPSDRPTYHQRLYAGFIGDTVRIHPKVAVDLGLRYEAYSPIGTSRNGASIFTPGSTSLSQTNEFGDYQWKNFSPRIGIAVRLAERTVVRTSYTINYFPVPFSLLPFNQSGVGTSQGVAGGFGFTSFQLPNLPAGATSTSAQNVPFFVNRLTDTPYVQSYFFMLQQSMPWGFLFDAAYVGNNARHLPGIRSLNAALPGTGVTGLPLGSNFSAGVFETSSGLNSNYNSLQVNLGKRLAKALSFQVGYTYGKALDRGTFLMNGTSFNSNYAPADWDRRHILAISHVIDLPFGAGTDRWNSGVIGKILGSWQINGLFHWATGAPFSVLADPLACNCPGNFGVFGNFVGGTFDTNGQASFNPAFFTAPSANSFGTSGRNMLRGPDLSVYNLALFKTFPVRENYRVELRGEAYNLLNSTQFGNPYSNVSFANFGQASVPGHMNGLFGGGGRLFMVGARILF